MPKYELEDTKHSEIDPAEDQNLESDSDNSSFDDVEAKYESEDPSKEGSELEEGTPEEEKVTEEKDSQEDSTEETGDDLDEMIPEMKEPDVGPFDLGSGLALKVGDKVTASHLAELNRGYMRESTFTQKCQEIAKVRDESQAILTNFNEVIRNEHTHPGLLFNHITPEHAIRALASIGLDIDPALLQQIGYGNSYRNRHENNPGQMDPRLEQEIRESREWRQQREQQEFTANLDKEVKSTISDIKNQHLQRELYEAILVKLALNPDKSVAQVAKEERSRVRERYQNLFKAKKGKVTRVGKGSGSSSPVRHKAPDSWDAATTSALGRMGAR